MTAITGFTSARRLTAGGLALWLAASPASAAKWRKDKAAAGPRATLTGTVMIAGRPGKKAAKKVLNPWAAVYGGIGNGAQVEPENHVVVYLEGVAGTFPPPAEHAVLDQRNRQFTTDVLPVLVGTAVDFTNHDHLNHNVFSQAEPYKFDLGRRAENETQTRVLDKLPATGIGVAKLFCEIHANMHAVILIMRNPFWDVVPESGGTFTFEDVPPGTYTLTAWHATMQAAPVKVTLVAGKPATATLTLKAGE